MGFALAAELANRGANVLLVAGPVNLTIKHPLVKQIDVVSAKQMYNEATRLFGKTDGAIMCAAVADYRPLEPMDTKLKRKSNNLTIELTANPDISAELGRLKTKKQVLAGFALETNDEQKNAALKLQKKNLDFIVLNSLNDRGAGFQTDTNKITILDRNNKITKFELKSKQMVAADIVDYIEFFLTL